MLLFTLGVIIGSIASIVLIGLLRAGSDEDAFMDKLILERTIENQESAFTTVENQKLDRDVEISILKSQLENARKDIEMLNTACEGLRKINFKQEQKLNNSLLATTLKDKADLHTKKMCNLIKEELLK